MKVKDAMHKGAEWVDPGTPVVKIAARMRDLDIGAIPVGEDDRLIGMVTDRDIVVKGIANGLALTNMTARDVMTNGIFYCRDTEELGDALHIMEDNKIRRLPVIDKNKRMLGILSLGDVSHAASHEMAGELAAAVSEHHTR